jgi:DNA polymerase III delta prime subunit
MLWTEKYRPRNIDVYYGNETALLEARKWISEWRSGIPHKRALLIVGPPGCGKTSMAFALAGCTGKKLIETNASDARTKSSINELIGSTVTYCTNTIVLVDEVDGISSGVTELVKLIQKSTIPIICCCNDSSDQKLKPLIAVCVNIKIPRVPKKTCESIMKIVCDEEKVTMEPKFVEVLYETTNGDVRNMLIQAQQLCEINGSMRVSDIYRTRLAKNDQGKTLWECVEDIFKKQGTLDDRMEYHNDYFFLHALVVENYPKINKDISACAFAAETIAFADTMDLSESELAGSLSTVVALAKYPPTQIRITTPASHTSKPPNPVILDKIRAKVGGDAFSLINEVLPIIQGDLCLYLSVRHKDVDKAVSIAKFYGFTSDETFELAASVLQPKSDPVKKRVQALMDNKPVKKRKLKK